MKYITPAGGEPDGSASPIRLISASPTASGSGTSPLSPRSSRAVNPSKDGAFCAAPPFHPPSPHPRALSRHSRALSQALRRPQTPLFPDRLYRPIHRLLPIFAVWFRCHVRRPAFSPSQPMASAETTEMCPAARKLPAMSQVSPPETCRRRTETARASPPRQLRSCFFPAAQLRSMGGNVYFACGGTHLGANPRAAAHESPCGGAPAAANPRATGRRVSGRRGAFSEGTMRRSARGVWPSADERGAPNHPL